MVAELAQVMAMSLVCCTWNTRLTVIGQTRLGVKALMTDQERLCVKALVGQIWMMVREAPDQVCHHSEELLNMLLAGEIPKKKLKEISI